MKITFQFLILIMIFLVGQETTFAQGSFQFNGNPSKGKAPAGKFKVPKTGPCLQATDPVYYGVGLFNGGTLVQMIEYGSHTLTAAEQVTEVRVFGNFGWETSSGTNITYENSGSGMPTMTEGETITVHTGSTPKEAVAYYDANLGTGSGYPIYFGTGDQLNLGGGYTIKSIKIAQGCRVEVNGKFYYEGEANSISATYDATLYPLPPKGGFKNSRR